MFSQKLCNCLLLKLTTCFCLVWSQQIVEIHYIFVASTHSSIFSNDRWGRAKPSDGSNVEEMQVRINKNPFAEGNARIAYYGKMNSLGGPKNYIYKEFKHVQDKSNVFRRYLQQMEVSAIANYLGNENMLKHSS